MELLRFESICFSYDGNRNILINANASFNSGQIYCINGQSGSGKSTLCSIILGYEKIYYGKIIRLSNKISYISNIKSLFLNFTVLENIFILNNNNNLNIVLEMFKILKLPVDIKNKLVKNLSYIEMKKVELIRASLNYDIILVDDISLYEYPEIINLFKYLKRHNKCIILCGLNKNIFNIIDHLYEIENCKLLLKK